MAPEADKRTAEDRLRVVAWVSTEIVPHEAAVRSWLRPRVRSEPDIDDLVQETYAKLASLTAVDQIAHPRGYLFQTVRNLLTDHIRRERIVQIEAVADIEELHAPDHEPGPEQVVGDRREVARVLALIDDLPDRCRRIFRLRKLEGVSQREIARRLNVSESIVENDVVKGLRLVMQAMRAGEAQDRPPGRRPS